ncbi:MAG: ATP-binding cassette domain-containing protein [Gemmatimonadaceae bacterium]|nr:ATP-binding cassette domain-containing protein [Gemmatimonadaceae bacterium]
MTLISFSDVTVGFGATTLLKGVTFTVAVGERWGIVGRNGAGKTTIFRLLTGAQAATGGAIAKKPGIRIAMLDQHRDFGEAATVWDAAASSYAEVIALERSLNDQGMRLAELGERVTEADLERYGHDQERFAHAGGYEFHARVDAVLQGLGFDAEESKARKLSVLSGGERGRVGLAAQLAAPADLVLLDEPTNHLDLETTDWLRRYLGQLGETVMVISHDRAFLDDTVDHVLHVSAGTTTAYSGGYSAFVTQKAERELSAQRAFDKQRSNIAKEEDYIRRNIAGQNSAQAKGRRKRLERLPRLSPPPGEAGAMTVRLENGERGGDQVLITDRLRVTVGERELVRDFSGVARRGDVIALVGPNGAGKSTLIATMLGERAAAAGSAKLGGSVTPAWYRQDMAQVPLDKAIYDCIADLRPFWTRGGIQNHLGAFGFSGDEVFRSTSTLSGGERARVALAIIVLLRANFLILDEPTNHLDVESIESLEDAIDEYEGTVLVVSHDRAFLRELSTRVWAFDGTRLEDFDAPFVEWEARSGDRAKERAAAAAAKLAAEREAERVKAAKAAKPKQESDEKKRAAKRALADAERAVERADAAVLELETALADPTLYSSGAEGARRAAALDKSLTAARRDAASALSKWESLLAEG